jgi:hypothetical protein
MWTREVPQTVYEKLIGGFVRDTARDLLDQHAEGRVLHPGDPFGHVLAWLWATQPDDAVAVMADVLAEIRYHARGADRTITLDELLSGVQFAIHDMPDHDADALVARLRADVPGRFDGDVTSKPGVG